MNTMSGYMNTRMSEIYIEDILKKSQKVSGDEESLNKFQKEFKQRFLKEFHKKNSEEIS